MKYQVEQTENFCEWLKKTKRSKCKKVSFGRSQEASIWINWGLETSWWESFRDTNSLREGIQNLLHKIRE